MVKFTPSLGPLGHMSRILNNKIQEIPGFSFIRDLAHWPSTSLVGLYLRTGKRIYLNSVTVTLVVCYLKTENVIQLEKLFFRLYLIIQMKSEIII